MRIISTNRLEPGMKLGKPVYSPNGAILLAADVKLTSSYINQLIQKSIPAVYVNDTLSEGITTQNVVDDEVQIKVIDTIKNVISDLKPDKLRNNKTYLPENHYNQIKNCINLIIENIKKNRNCLFNLVEIMSTDLYTYTHSVNVAILSILIANDLGLNESLVQDIGTGALLHDIGKACISPDILNKPANLTSEEFEEIKKHTIKGYEMVKDDRFISAYVKSIILMHHEKLDGTGYPLKLKGDSLHKSVRIVTACDIFEALTSDRVYRKRMSIYKAIEQLQGYVPYQVDNDIYNSLIMKIDPYPQGTCVLLNTGEKCIVTQTNNVVTTRPVVKVVYENDGTLCKRLKAIDLMQSLTTFIEDTCDI